MQLLFFSLPLLVVRADQIFFDGKNATTPAKSIIIDTDMMSDVDDVGALAIANVLHNGGLCDLKAVMINTHSEYGALTASAINTYFNNGHIPIASPRPITNETFFDKQTFLLSDYASKIAHNFPRTLHSTTQTPTPQDLYTSLLASSPDHSLTLISLGFLTNIASLPPSLLHLKTKELVIMGGQYPQGREYNFLGGGDGGSQNPTSTATLLNTWPPQNSPPITFSGLEFGSQILSGQNLRHHSPADSPVLAAYEWYNGRCNTIRESWDPVTVLYGILGLDGLAQFGLWESFEYANSFGYNWVNATDGSNAWVNDPMVTNQHWLRLRDGVSNFSVASVLTQFLAHDPGLGECFG